MSSRKTLSMKVWMALWLPSASHIAIVMDDAIDVGETERIEACIRKLMEKFKEVGYSA